MSDDPTKIAFWTLGCSKNTYDSEKLMNRIDKDGFQIVSLSEDPNAIILNTCGFIDEAKEQSIDAILECCEWKKENKIDKVIAMGCLTQRYKDEIKENIPELDAIFGVDQFDEMLDYCQSEMETDANHVCGNIEDFLSLTPGHWSYLKISDGCSNGCTFCAIPAMKGLLKDRSVDDILEEVKRKYDRGVKEFVIIGQDPTHYGEDDSGEKFLDLLTKICEVEGDFWVRVLYAFPGHLSKLVIDFISETPKMVNYIDMPVQHANTYMLKRMGRATTQKKILELMEHAWSKTPRIHMRSTVIVGFPGETEEHFDDMLNFISQYKFDRLGAFGFSSEDGTPASLFEEQIDQDVIDDRLSRFESIQNNISDELSMLRIGSFEKVLVDKHRPDLGENIFEVRSQAEAPEVDNLMLLDSDTANVGEWREVIIEDYQNGEIWSKDHVKN